MAYGPKPKLNAAQVAVAKELCAKGWSFRQVAIKMGVGPNVIYRACDPRYYQRVDRRNARQREAQKAHTPRHGVKRWDVPQEVMDERDQRAEFKRNAPLSVTLLGDPTPGRSALDQKRR